MGLRGAVHRRRGGERIKKALGNAELALARIQRKITKIEAHADMAERLVRYLVIEEALQNEIKDTLKQKNQSYFEWCALSSSKKRRTRLNIPIHGIWDGRRDHLVGDITPLADLCGRIKGVVGMVLMLRKIDEKKHKNMNSQRTSREYEKLWRLLQ